MFYEPPVRQEPVQAPVRIPTVRNPKSGKDWTNFWKGEQFTDSDNIRYYISSVMYDSELQSWVVVFVKVGQDDIERNREVQSFKDILQVSANEDWFSPYIYQFFNSRKWKVLLEKYLFIFVFDLFFRFFILDETRFKT